MCGGPNTARELPEDRGSTRKTGKSFAAGRQAWRVPSKNRRDITAATYDYDDGIFVFSTLP